MEKEFSLNVNAGHVLHDVSDMLFGIFLEDINFACDGGLNANLVNNASFDGVYLSRKGYGMMRSLIFKPDPHPLVDRLRYWIPTGTTLESRHDDPVAENSWYARVTVNGACRLENLGYNGVKKRANDCAMSIQAGQDYAFSCWVRGTFQGSMAVSVMDENGLALTGTVQVTPGSQWQEHELILPGSKTGYGKLVIQFEGKGSVDLDGIHLMSSDTWGKGDPKWSQGRLRRDLVEALRNLKPRFLRFPGGCIVEGNGPGNEYNWKDTIGPLINRKGKYNLWAAQVRDGGYYQSYEVGFYEYFLLCEDLGMQPLPTLFAGLNCQARSKHCVDTHSAAFQEQVVQNYLDLIEYANGDPATNPWATKRAEAGHPQPFGLKYIGIGNENFGPDYLEKFTAIKKAIDAVYTGITCVMSCGSSPQGKEFDSTWAKARASFPDVCVDEHCYNRPNWFIQGNHRYDAYPREGAKVYMGEYAANFPMNMPLMSVKPNSYQTALAEAVFLAGLERNSDVVAMSSYAPLLSQVDGEQWAHNLINFNPAQLLLTANYFVQKMYSSTVGDKVLEMQGEMPGGVYGSATATEDRLILKLVNTNSLDIQVNLHLEDIPDGKAQVEYLQSEDLNATNTLPFRGAPEYVVQPIQKKLVVKDGAASLALKPNGFYVLIVKR
ncbi:MAG TPA: alpha-L-arabinofuranosidase C-terminal domain-containing protein [Anaerolineaceae bacterium]|nr:alpha-L-arabinofuranosidase C-terminal domain-containing protein [Anaerolineaceae bacterium]